MKNPKSLSSFTSLRRLFAVVRDYNIALLFFVYYSLLIYPRSRITNSGHSSRSSNFALVVSNAITTAVGFIINDFYDSDKDRINRLEKHLLEQLISL